MSFFYNEMAFFTLDFWPKMVVFFGFYHILDFYRCSLVLNHFGILTKYDRIRWKSSKFWFFVFFDVFCWSTTSKKRHKMKKYHVFYHKWSLLRSTSDMFQVLNSNSLHAQALSRQNTLSVYVILPRSKGTWGRNVMFLCVAKNCPKFIS